MLPGRWGVLLAVFVVALVVRRTGGIVKPSVSLMVLLLCFLNFGVLLPFAVNPVLAGAKWLVFAIFLLICLLLTSNLHSRAHILQYIRPLIPVFLAYIWLNPLGLIFLPQPFGYGVAGVMRNPNSLGLYLVLFALPLVLYCLETTTSDWQRKLYLATSVLAVILVIGCGSRTAVGAAAILLAIGFWRWERFNGRRIRALKVLLIGGFFLIIPFKSPDIETFVYKYPDAHTLLESRTPYWDATYQAFLERRWAGAGFGIQASEGKSSLTYATTNSLRRAEQGSTFLGLLEEVGVLGGVPFFFLLIVTAFRQILVLWFSHDPLQILFARSMVAGLVWAVAENYLLALGNAASILFFLSFFFSERLLQIHRKEKAVARRTSRPPELHRHRRYPLSRPAGAF